MRWQACLAVLFLCPAIHATERQVEQQPSSNVLEPVLRDELLEMFKEDQAARIQAMRKLHEQGMPVGGSLPLKNAGAVWTAATEGVKTAFLDFQHRERLKQIIDQHGWPGKTLVGRDGAMSAWLIAQHADLDVPFQERCLQLMKAAPPDDVERQHIALLTDRVLVNRNKKQCFGTQMGANFEPRPIEDPQHVDQRRAKVGLPPLADYIKTTREVYEKMANASLNPNPPEK